MHLSRQNLGIPIINKSQIIVLNDDDTNNTSKLPSNFVFYLAIGIPEHSLLKGADPKKFKEIPTVLAPKLVGSNLREWGRTVHSNSVSNIVKKYK